MNTALSVDSSISALCDTSSVLFELWKRAGANLNKSELEYFVGATEYAQNEAKQLRHVVSGIGSLIASDPMGSALQDQSGVSTLLYSISSQLDTIGGMIEIGCAASDRLRLIQIKEGR